MARVSVVGPRIYGPESLFFKHRLAATSTVLTDPGARNYFCIYRWSFPKSRIPTDRRDCGEHALILLNFLWTIGTELEQNPVDRFSKLDP